MFLKQSDIDAESYPSIEAFLQGHRPRRRACLLLDHHLQGGTTGLEFLRSLECGALQIPVILMTAARSEALQAEALAAGAVAYLEKPFDCSTLITTIYAVLAAPIPATLSAS